MKTNLFLALLIFSAHTLLAQLLLAENSNGPNGSSFPLHPPDVLDTNCECKNEHIIINKAKLEGYLDKTSYKVGEVVRLYAHTLDKKMTVELIYHDVIDKVIQKTQKVCVKIQDYTSCAYKNGCNWSPNLYYKLEDNLKSGYYSFRLITKSKTYDIPFVISPTLPTYNEIAVLASTNTWQAYNEYGGASFYKYSNDDNACNLKFATLLSFERPNNMNSVHNTNNGHLLSSEHLVTNWLTLNNYTYDVIGDDLLDQDSTILLNYKVVIVNSHSEYWTENMYNHFESFLNNGGSAMSLGANQIYWKVVRKDNQIECMKLGNEHTLQSGKGGKWRSLSRPESKILGVEFSNDGFNTYAPYKVLNDTNWVFKGTNLKSGDLFGEKTITGKDLRGASGHETDKMTINSPSNTILLAKGQNPTKEDTNDFGKGGADITIYEHPAGGAVFATGSISYNGSLIIDKNISQITKNVLDNFLKR